MKKFDFPTGLKYTEEHEWTKAEGGNARIGITDYAQDALTDVVFVELPGKGKKVKKGDVLGVVESVKSVSDIYSPVAGEVVETNTALNDHPELVNSDPYGKGWYCVIRLADAAELDGLLSPDAYRALVESK
ncbi:MAG: glycine cleavage system protein GcvH [Methanobacteriota archaeon]